MNAFSFKKKKLFELGKLTERTLIRYLNSVETAACMSGKVVWVCMGESECVRYMCVCYVRCERTLV